MAKPCDLVRTQIIWIVPKDLPLSFTYSGRRGPHTSVRTWLDQCESNGSQPLELTRR